MKYRVCYVGHINPCLSKEIHIINKKCRNLNTYMFIKSYLPIPVAGFVMTFDSILFLTGIVKKEDLLYSEPEIDYTDEETIERIRKAGEAEAEREMMKGGQA